MTEKNNKSYKVASIILVLIMMLIQTFYAIFAFVDPSAFAVVRGTDLMDLADSDWVLIYASRTLFVALIIGYLVYIQNFKVLKWAALFGIVMPLTDAILAYQAEASTLVIGKHIGTAVYLVITFLVLHICIKKSSQ